LVTLVGAAAVPVVASLLADDAEVVARGFCEADVAAALCAGGRAGQLFLADAGCRASLDDEQADDERCVLADEDDPEGRALAGDDAADAERSVMVTADDAGGPFLPGWVDLDFLAGDDEAEEVAGLFLLAED